MKFDTLSIVVGTRACNANCKFCVSKITCNESKKVMYDYHRLEIALRLGSHLDEVILTGVGEPTLDPDNLAMLTYRIFEADFPIITLQTNGIDLNREYLQRLYDAGLSRVALSVCSLDSEVNDSIMGAKMPDPFEFTKMAAGIGLSTRLAVVVTKEAFGLGTEKLHIFMDSCSLEKSVNQLTFRELGGDSEWNTANYVGLSEFERSLLQRGAIELFNFDYGARVYDFSGQNVCIASCLTESTNPDRQRQLIYYPDGRLRFSWQHQGAVIL